MAVYIIKKGRHSSGVHIAFHAGTLVESRMVTVTGTWRHEGIKSIHKLWGFCYGIHHHFNSARLGLKLFDDYIRLMTYVYDAGMRMKEKKIADLPYDSTFKSTIVYTDNVFIFSVNDTDVDVPVSQSPCAGYYLYPYFGGKETPERDVITIIAKNTI